MTLDVVAGAMLTPPTPGRMSAFKGEAVISLNQSLVSEWQKCEEPTG